MTLRLFFPAFACGLLGLAGTAAAQYQPLTPGPYRAPPPGAYRSLPPPVEDDEDGPYVSADPSATYSVPGQSGRDSSQPRPLLRQPSPAAARTGPARPRRHPDFRPAFEPARQ